MSQIPLDRKIELLRILRDYVPTRKEMHEIENILRDGGWKQKDSDFWISTGDREFPIKAAAKIELTQQISDGTILMFNE